MSWAELSDVRCYYEVLGQGDPLLLIPGLGATCRCWDAVAPDLAPFFSLVLIDNRGVGRSVPKRHARSLRDYAADVVELLDELQLDRVHVLGLSLGGLIAQRLAIEHPSRVDRLVLMSCPDAFSPYLRQMVGLLAQSLRKFNKEMFARTVEILGSSPEYTDAHPGEIERRVREKMAAPVSRGALGRQLRCLACSEIPPDQYHIPAPTLVVAGERDSLIPSCYGRRMASKIPGSRFLLVRCAGHNPLVECPQVVLPPVVRFLRGEPVPRRVRASVGTSESSGNGAAESLTECPDWAAAAAARPGGCSTNVVGSSSSGCADQKDRLRFAKPMEQGGTGAKARPRT